MPSIFVSTKQLKFTASFYPNQSEIVNIDAISHLKLTPLTAWLKFILKTKVSPTISPLPKLLREINYENKYDATTGNLIGLILSIIFSFIHSPRRTSQPQLFDYQFMTQHVHGRSVPFTQFAYLGSDWSPLVLAVVSLLKTGVLRATVTTPLPYVARFCPLAILAGWFPRFTDFILQAIPRVCNRLPSSGLFFTRENPY